MGRPSKVDSALFATVISEYIIDDIRGFTSLSLSDREIALRISDKLGITINKEYIRNFRRSQGIASGVTWGGPREGAGRPSNINDGFDENVPDYKGVIDLSSRFATDRLHEKCVLALSRMYGGGDCYLYAGGTLDRGRGSGKVGKGGGINNIRHSQAYFASGGQ